MQFKKLVIWNIILLSLMGGGGGLTLQTYCPRYVIQFCACTFSHEITIVPLKICYDEGHCKPCPENPQDCDCPGKRCPICSLDQLNLYSLLRAENGSRKTRVGKYAELAFVDFNSWCPIDDEYLNGKFKCKNSPYKKECKLECHEKYHGQDVVYECSRNENVWMPEFMPCVPKERKIFERSMKNDPAVPKGSHEYHATFSDSVIIYDGDMATAPATEPREDKHMTNYDDGSVNEDGYSESVKRDVNGKNFYEVREDEDVGDENEFEDSDGEYETQPMDNDLLREGKKRSIIERSMKKDLDLIAPKGSLEYHATFSDSDKIYDEDIVTAPATEPHEDEHWTNYDDESVNDDGYGESVKRSVNGKNFYEVREDEDVGDENELEDSDADNVRTKRRSPKRYTEPGSPWCEIDYPTLNGILTCTVWIDKKECELKCFKNYYAQDVIYKCSREENVWAPELLPCKPKERKITDRSLKKDLGALLPLAIYNYHVTTSTDSNKFLGNNMVTAPGTHPDEDEYVERDVNAENARKDKRSLKHHSEQEKNSWCEIGYPTLHGNLHCTVWTHKKECKLDCHEKYYSQDVIHKCSRKENVWVPDLLPCVPEERNITDRSLKKDLGALLPIEIYKYHVTTSSDSNKLLENNLVTAPGTDPDEDEYVDNYDNEMVNDYADGVHVKRDVNGENSNEVVEDENKHEGVGDENENVNSDDEYDIQPKGKDLPREEEKRKITNRSLKKDLGFLLPIQIYKYHVTTFSDSNKRLGKNMVTAPGTDPDEDEHVDNYDHEMVTDYADGIHVKRDVNAENARKEKRSPKYHSEQEKNSWCESGYPTLHGNLHCKVWTHKKECKLECHEKYYSQDVIHKCSRKENVWVPDLLPCVPEAENSTKEKRSLKRDTEKEKNSWCEIDYYSLHGNVQCKRWYNKKECEVKCFRDYYRQDVIHKCSRKENVWVPEFLPCVPKELDIVQRSLKNDLKPLVPKGSAPETDPDVDNYLNNYDDIEMADENVDVSEEFPRKELKPKMPEQI